MGSDSVDQKNYRLPLIFSVANDEGNFQQHLNNFYGFNLYYSSQLVK